MKKKQPWIAALLNLVLFGFGYLYIGKKRVFGSMLVISDLILYIFLPIPEELLMLLLTKPLFFVSTVFLFVAFAYDGYDEAKQYNLSLEIAQA